MTAAVCQDAPAARGCHLAAVPSQATQAVPRVQKSGDGLAVSSSAGAGRCFKAGSSVGACEAIGVF